MSNFVECMFKHALAYHKCYCDYYCFNETDLLIALFSQILEIPFDPSDRGIEGNVSKEHLLDTVRFVTEILEGISG